MSMIFEIIIVLLSAVLGFILIIRTLLSNRYQKELWSTFSNVARKFGLNVRNSSTIKSNYPDIYGKIDDRKVYLHPAKKKMGFKPRSAKTVIGLELGARIEESIIITKSSTETKKDDLLELDIDKLEKYKLKVKSESKLNENILKEMIDNSVARKLNNLVKESGDNFRALIIESGLLMFSTYGFQGSEDTINEYIQDLYEITVEMEENLGEIEDIYNDRFAQLEERNYAISFKYIIEISLALVGMILIISSFEGMYFVLLNIGIVILAVALVMIYSLTSLILKGRS
ncbi:MAG: hypothetical protein ACOC5D_05015 [Thermoplasmatota archaeon]